MRVFFVCFGMKILFSFQAAKAEKLRIRHAVKQTNGIKENVVNDYAGLTV